jgi:hypothetical protein
VAQYDAIFGVTTAYVPVESQGGSGTAGSHWSDSLFNNELMTGYINSGKLNPLSKVTVGSLQDLGYTVNYAAADAYTAGASLRGNVLSSSTTVSSSAHLNASDSVSIGQTLIVADLATTHSFVVQTGAGVFSVGSNSETFAVPRTNTDGSAADDSTSSVAPFDTNNRASHNADVSSNSQTINQLMSNLKWSFDGLQ